MSNKTKTYYSIGEFAKLINKSVLTLRHWDSIGVFKADHRTVGGKRFYHHKQLINKIYILCNSNSSLLKNKLDIDLIINIQFVYRIY